MEKVDTTIIGAGVVGLAIAAQISQPGNEVYVIERRHTFGQETSSRNSEVIHSGIYYPHGTLKAKTCVEGNKLLYEICAKAHIPHKRIGKLIVATCDNECQELESLLNRGMENGVQGLSIIDRDGIKKLEPHIDGVAALYSPNTGIIDSHSLMQYFANTAQSKGTEFIYGATVVGIEQVQDRYKVTIIDTDGEHFSFLTKVVINSAGLDSDSIAKLVGINNYNLHYCKGDYFSVGHNKNKLVNRLIYPVPNAQSTVLGIHSTLDMQGRLRLGPDDYYIPRTQDYSVDASKSNAFYHSVKQFLPFIELSDLSPEQSGIRAKLQGQDEGFRDFVIQNEQSNGLHGFINLIGIESPGLTASPSIAKYVSEIL